MKKILIIEDDKDLREELSTFLTRNGYEACALTVFENVCRQILESSADMVLLDIVLPGCDGQQLLRELRMVSEIPVIMLTSKNTEMDEVLCMSFGADDFIAKPYNPALLLLHMQALFRRTGPSENILHYQNLIIDADKGLLKTDMQSCELSKNEMKILLFLFKHKGQIVTRDSLINYLWEQEEFIDDNTLTVNISRVRKKLEELGFPDVIRTKRGQGYMIL